MLVTPEQARENTYDYIICGGGTAGLCLAARLSEDANTTVLVIEAGEANLNDPVILRPASYGAHFGNPAYEWGHKTVPQKFANGTEFPWQRGKGLGGSSAINFMVWSKPPSSDIDDFERLGNEGWNWKNYCKYLSRAERFVYPTDEDRKKRNLQPDSRQTDANAPLLTAFPGKVAAAELELQQALLNFGIPLARDPLNGDPTGVFFSPSTLDPTTHTRSYATTAFYLPNASRPNLNVLVSSLVHRVILDDGPNGKAIAKGVEFSSVGSTGTLYAKKEVILSAGALKTPQILELSGIGDSALLNKLQIPLKIDLPSVGENLQEHIFASLSWELKDDVSYDTLDVLRDPKVAEEHVELHKAGQGMFTTGVVGFAFTPLEMISERAEDIYLNLKAKVAKSADSYPPGLLDFYKIQLERRERRAPGCEVISFPGFFSAPNTPQPGKKYITAMMAMNHCLSRGNAHITSNSASVDAAYDPHYFEEETDLLTFVEQIKFARKLAEVEPFKSMIVSEINPGPEVKDDEQIKNWLKSYLFTTYHSCGTASMLPKEKGGVVDNRLKVYGTENLRVVDLSIVPIHFAAHSVASVYAIAEQAADIIKSEA